MLSQRQRLTRAVARPKMLRVSVQVAAVALELVLVPALQTPAIMRTK